MVDSLFHELSNKHIVLDQYEIVANKRTGIGMYADAGDRTRTYRVTVKDDPMTPQRHIFKKDRITAIYNTNRFTSSDKEEICRFSQ